MQKQIERSLVALLFALIFPPFGASGQVGDPQKSSKSVFEISVPGGSRATEISTGFKLAGTPGLVTSLHGVAGVERGITATNFVDRSIWFNMKVVEIDFDHDLARLMPDQGSSGNFPAPESGFTPLPEALLPQIIAGVRYTVIGNPLGIRNLPREQTFGRETSRSLFEVTPVSAQLKERKSPASDSVVWSLIGAVMYYGDSGAPVLVTLNGKEYVIGAVDGGLANLPNPQGGSGFDYAWAIRLRDVKWSALADSQTYKALAENGAKTANLFFALSSTAANPPPCEDHVNESCLADSTRLFIDRKKSLFGFHEMYLWLNVPQSVRQQIKNVRYMIALRNPIVPIDASLLKGATPSIGLVRFQYKSCDELMAKSQMEVTLVSAQKLTFSFNPCVKEASGAGELPNEVNRFSKPPQH